MDVHSTIDQILALVENARSMPMSGSCVVNRGELVQLVSDLREQLPAELQDARWVLERREAIIGDGREQAGRIVEDARAQAGRIVESAQAERARLVAQTEITAAATEEAERLVRDAHAGAEQVRDETDSYVDRKLAAVGALLDETLVAVEHGRRSLAGRVEATPAPRPPSDSAGAHRR